MLWSRISAFFFNRMNRTNIGSSVLCARVPGLAPQITKAFFSRIRKRTTKNKKSTRRIRAPHSFATQLSLDSGKIGHATATAIATQAEIKKNFIVQALCYSQLSSRNNNRGIQATTAARAATATRCRAATATRCTPFMGTIRHPYQQGTVEFRYAHTMRTR